MEFKLVAVVLSIVLLGFLVQWQRAARVVRPKGTKIPPGPPGKRFSKSSSKRLSIGADREQGKPIVGNFFDVPKSQSWLMFKSWADIYGPLFKLNIVGRNIIVVSSEKIANDLLRERGTLYSSREQLPMAAKLLSRNLRPLLLPYGGKKGAFQ